MACMGWPYRPSKAEPKRLDVGTPAISCVPRPSRQSNRSSLSVTPIGCSSGQRPEAAPGPDRFSAGKPPPAAPVSASGSSGRRCWRSVGASALSLSIARFVSATTRSNARCNRARAERRCARDRRPRQQHVPLREQVADLLVRCDPRRGDSGIAQHPEPERPLPSRRVVVERDRHSPVGQLVEGAALHCLADLPFDDAFPRRTDRDLALAVASLRHHTRIVAAT